VALTNDEVSRVAKTDQLIRGLGEQLCAQHGHDRSKHGFIRNAMREVARLVVQLRTDGNNKEHWLKDYLKSTSFELVVDATRKVSGFKPGSNSYSTPSLALKIGHSVLKCAGLLKGNALANGDDATLKTVDQYIALHKLRWKTCVSGNALRTLHDAKKNVITSVPLSADIKLLTAFLKTKIETFTSRLLSKHDDTEAYSMLQQAVLCALILFNRRRAGEVSKMKLEDYHGSHSTGDLAKDLEMSPLERELCRHFKRIEIYGKRGRLVPVLLSKPMVDALELLLKSRRAVGVNSENCYVFACIGSSSSSYIRGVNVLRRFSQDCGAARPEALRSTKLRKHIATMTQVLNLKDNELDVVAQFMGHDVRIHRDFYRLPEATVQMATVSKLLLALESGNLGSQKGKTLAEIDLNEPLDGRMAFLDLKHTRLA
jgi:hypothetical protein